ncbi:delta-latroinsectotoxin-Lt1a [Aethina tumida]|uniref:delta-latroinsectotoxin-Lt1a n=1 Tax=Aethina tumida TaxID=116153 RepID=UPI0021474456|nr:delta-latroinsectotoxin-Lt1a [Aethina tumida]
MSSNFGPPDSSDDEFSGISDDGGYEDFKGRIKKAHVNQQDKLTPEQIAQRDRKRQLQDFYNAVSWGDKKYCFEQLNKGFDVNQDLESGWTPLLLACSYGQLELVDEFIKLGADVNYEKNGHTPLMLACNCPNYTTNFSKSLQIIQKLVENGADVNKTDRKRMNALMFAASNGNLEAIKYLLPLCDKNSKDNQDWTPLFWAINGKHENVVKFLLEQGVDYTKNDVRGFTPVELAKYNDLDSIVALFPEDVYEITDFNAYYSNALEECSNNKPKFFWDVCNILIATRSDALLKLFHDKDLSLLDFLSLTDQELKELGVEMPYQRRRILSGIHRFHKHIWNNNSLLKIKKKEAYSNIDLATQLVTTIKQVIAMEASIKYITKNYNGLTVEEVKLTKENIHKIKMELGLLDTVSKQLLTKTSKWDNMIEPADLITRKSLWYRMPWWKIYFGGLLCSIIAIVKYRR